MNQLKKVLGVLLVAVLSLAACGGTAQGDKTLYVAIEKTFSTLNPQDSNVLAEKEVIGQYMEGLFGYDADNTLIPLGAKGVDITTDGLTYTFTLRPEVKWANGEVITANDYVFAWQTLVSNKLAAFRNQAEVIKNADAIMKDNKPKEELGVKALDEQTLQVELVRPYPAFLHMISTSTFYPIHAETFQKADSEAYGTTPDNIMENGPFLFDSYEVGAKIILKKNPEYWDVGNVKLDTVDITVVPELATQSVLFDNKELDIIRLQGELVDTYKNTENVIQGQENRILYMYLAPSMENSTAALKNKNFRQAIAHSINKTLIAENIMKDGAVAQDGLFPRGFIDVKGQDFRDFSAKYNDPMFDVDKAVSYLEEAKKELGVEQITFNFAVQDMVTTKKIFENVKSQVEENLPGVTMNLEVMANQIYFPTLLEHTTPAAMVTWSASYIDYRNFTNQFEGDSSYNLAGYKNQTFDEKVKAGAIESDPVKQAKLFAEAEAILLDDAACIPLYQSGASYKINPQIKNFSIRGAAPSIAYKYLSKE